MLEDFSAQTVRLVSYSTHVIFSVFIESCLLTFYFKKYFKESEIFIMQMVILQVFTGDTKLTCCF